MRFRNNMAETQDFLFTFTYDHNDYTIDEANARVSNDLKKMRTYIHRIFDSRFGTITSYESTKSGYPAPHMIVRLDRSYPVFSHLNKETLRRSWHLTDKEMKEKLQTKWKMIGGGWCDIKGIVDDESDSISAKIGYSFKYLEDRCGRRLRFKEHNCIEHARQQQGVQQRQCLHFIGIHRPYTESGALST